tara:strand:- start:23 stop:547 length:525 start_codon:yes stop_codon:yes gene_type:complete
MESSKDNFWKKIIYIISIAISGAVAFLILGPRPEGIKNSLDVSNLPFINAFLNFITTVLLILGYTLIRKGKIKKHKLVMQGAFGTSTLFLISYVIYHWFKIGPKLYIGEWVMIYYSILFSHIILAMIILPLALFTLYRGWNMHIEKHKNIARITLPLWLYVSITGILVYVMLYI